MKVLFFTLWLLSIPENVGNTANGVNPKCDCHSYHDIYMTVVPESRIPNNEADYKELAKVFKCERWPGLKPAYIRDYTINKTLVFCSPPKNITGGYCPEWNNGNVQERYPAPCRNFPTPCPFKYNIWESYSYRGCFIKDSEGQQNQSCPESGDIHIVLVVLVVLLIVSLLGNVVTVVVCCCGKKRDKASSSSSVETELTAINMLENEENGIKNAPIQVTDDVSIIYNGGKKETEEDGALNDPSEVPEYKRFLHDIYHDIRS